MCISVFRCPETDALIRAGYSHVFTCVGILFHTGSGLSRKCLLGTIVT